MQRMVKLFITYSITMVSLCCIALPCYAQADNQVPGQIIQINTRFSSFTGKPIWLLEIRDLDHNENIPYMFEVTQKEQYWVIYLPTKNYVINASNMQFSPYKANPYLARRLDNFCNLQGNGRIMKGASMYINIDGRLTPNRNTVNCKVTTYTDANVTVTDQN